MSYKMAELDWFPGHRCGQDTRIIQGQAWVDDRQTISRGLGGENKPGKRAGIRTQEIRLGIQGKHFVG